MANSVAPPVGAWIETSLVRDVTIASLSRLPWARGLKLIKGGKLHPKEQSRLPWARGLKPPFSMIPTSPIKSRLPWARGLKHFSAAKTLAELQSRLPWARGLKHVKVNVFLREGSRASRGRVD